MSRSSLRGRLLWLILGVLALVLVPLAIYSLRRTTNEVNELSDGRLAQSARTLQTLISQIGLPALQRHNVEAGVVVPITARSTQELVLHGHTYESEVGFQVFDRDHRPLLVTGNLTAMPPPDTAQPGFRNLRYGNYRWRLFTLPPTADGVVVRAAERYDSRRDIRTALWIEHGLPPLIALPVLALLVGWAVRRGLRPLDALAEKLAARKPGSRDTLEVADAPRELEPVLAALNSQFTQLEEALERERRFSADVAHELRTPLASIQLNLESAMETVDPDEIQDSLAGAHGSVVTLGRRIEQLLALAKLEAGAASSPFEAVDLVDLADGVVKEFTPGLQRRGVELGFVLQDSRVVVQGYAPALVALLRNLLENSLRYVPAGGRIQLAVVQNPQEATLEVIDNGPGIPLERRHAVFARFHREAGSRGEGYGLGLSIVARAASLHRATIELLDSPFGRGLRVRVSIPLLCP